MKRGAQLGTSETSSIFATSPYRAGIFGVRIQNLKHRRSSTQNSLLDRNVFGASAAIYS